MGLLLGKKESVWQIYGGWRCKGKLPSPDNPDYELKGK